MIQDFRIALRALAQSRGFTGAALPFPRDRRIREGILYRVDAMSPLPYAVAAAILAAAGPLASSVPARRAARLEPMAALRQE